MPAPGLAKALEEQMRYAPQAHSKKKALATVDKKPPTERLFPAVEQHCKAGDAEAVRAVIRKAAMAGHPFDLDYTGPVRATAKFSQSSRLIALVAGWAACARRRCSPWACRSGRGIADGGGGY